MRTLFTLMIVATLLAAENAIVLPSKSDVGLFQIGFNGDVIYRQRIGPDFTVYYLTPVGLSAGCEILVYDGDHPDKSNDLKTIKKIKIDGQRAWEMEVKENGKNKGYSAIGYYPFGHQERLDERGELTYNDKDRVLQVIITALSIAALEDSLKTLSFSIVK